MYEVEEGTQCVPLQPPHKELDLAAVCAELGVHPSPEQEKVARHMVSCLETCPAVVVLGPVAAGKSVTVRLAHRSPPYLGLGHFPWISIKCTAILAIQFEKK